MNKREKVFEAARRFVKCGQDPNPGTFTWHESMERLYTELVDMCREEDIDPTTPVNNIQDWQP